MNNKWTDNNAFNAVDIHSIHSLSNKEHVIMCIISKTMATSGYVTWDVPSKRAIEEEIPNPFYHYLFFSLVANKLISLKNV